MKTMKTKKAVQKSQTMGDMMGKKVPKQSKARPAAKTPFDKMRKVAKAKKAY